MKPQTAMGRNHKHAIISEKLQINCLGSPKNSHKCHRENNNNNNKKKKNYIQVETPIHDSIIMELVTWERKEDRVKS
jgi:hypothetical protein